MEEITNSGVSRRSLVKGAAWSVPIIAVAASTPIAAASNETVVDGFSVDGSCGLLGAVNAGFIVKAGTTPLPVGTRILVTTNRTIADVNVISINGAGAPLADIDLLSSGSISVTLEEEVPAGGTFNLGWLLSISVLTNTTATLTLPTGYTAGDNVKNTGTLEQTLILCDGN